MTMAGRAENGKAAQNAQAGVHGASGQLFAIGEGHVVEQLHRARGQPNGLGGGLSWFDLQIGVVLELDELAQMIEAEERLGHIMDMAAAHGTLKRHAHRNHTKDLQRQARGPRHFDNGGAAIAHGAPLRRTPLS